MAPAVEREPQRLARNSEDAAFESIVAEYRDALYDFALRIVREPALAEDVAQEALVQAYLNTRSRPRGAALRAWLFRTTRNAALNCLRERKRRKTREQHYAVDRGALEINTPLKADTLTEELRAAVNVLPEEFQLPLVLHYLHNMPQPAIAEALQIPVGTVGSRISRGLERVRERLEGQTKTAALSVTALVALLSQLRPASAPSRLGTLVTIKQKIAVAKSSLQLKGALALVLTLCAVVLGLLCVKPTTALPTTSNPVDPQLQRLLASKLDVISRRDYLSEIASDLTARTGIRIAYPESIDRLTAFSFETHQTALSDILAKIAADGSLELEFRGDTVIFWKRADDTQLLQLTEALQQGDLNKKLEAIDELGAMGDPRIYPLLFDAMKNGGDPGVEAEVVLNQWHLKTLQFSRGAESIVEPLLKKFSYSTELRLIHLLVATQSPRIADAIVSLLKTNNFRERALTADAIAGTRQRRLLDELIVLLADPSQDVRNAAARSLGQSQDNRAIEPLITAMIKSEDRWEAGEWAADIKEIGGPVLANRVAELLKSENEKIRNAALTALAELQDSRAVQPLIELVKADPRRNTWAAFELGTTHDSRAVPVLASAHCFGALAEMRNPAAIEILLKEAECEDLLELRSVCWALGFTRHPKAVNVLLAKSAGFAEVRDAATAGLMDSRDPAAFDRLVEMIHDNDPRTRADGCNHISATREPRLVNALLKSLKDPRPEVRAAAAAALGRTGDPRGISALIELLNDSTKEVPAAAADVLRGIASLRARLALEAYERTKMQKTSPSIESGF